MKTIPVILKVMPAVVALPFLLTGCEDLKSFFGDTSQSPGYDSSYSSPDSQTKNHAASTTNINSDETKHSTSEGTKHRSSEETTDSQSGTAATTVSAPVGPDKPTVKGTVDAPVVPSMAPTVGQ
ncbi:MAG: hypothetical protein A3F46_04340 [Legionellales bacterium RIFCSPHIGHO2_12_FULL_42_9]|nr:MAG: hypothetical protein A3F46_04340 [Legionellales bacterium RIFCSPHIGHO2_12_FULL_42_9]